MLFNEPKLLKLWHTRSTTLLDHSFSALQRAEIAEILGERDAHTTIYSCFSALQRAEIAEICYQGMIARADRGFSALQRAEIAEILQPYPCIGSLLRFSALQRAEIAEIHRTCVAAACQ